MTVRVTKAGGTVTYVVDLADAKDHLGIIEEDQDAMIAAHVIAAHEWAEQYCNRAIASQDYLIVRDRFPTAANVWGLPLGVVETVTAVKYIDDDGNTQTWSSSEYETDLDTYYQPRLRPASGYSYPDIGEYLSAARVECTAGFHSSLPVPQTVKQAILLKVAALYESRAPGDEDPGVMEKAAETLLGPWTLPAW